MPLPTLTFEGRLKDDPELRYTPSGDAVVELTIACNQRRLNRETGEWEDGDVYWINRATAWKKTAEAIAEHLQAGDLVCGTIQLRSRAYTADDGTRRTAVDHRINTIGKTPRLNQTNNSSYQPPTNSDFTTNTSSPF